MNFFIDFFNSFAKPKNYFTRFEFKGRSLVVSIKFACLEVPEESSVKSSNPNGTEPVAKRGRKPKHKQTVNSDSEAEPENLPSKLKRTTLSSTGNESNDSMVTASSSLVAVESSPGVPPKKLAKKSAAKNKAIEKLTDVNDRQCQTSPWLYEEFRAERRKRRRQAYHE